MARRTPRSGTFRPRRVRNLSWTGTVATTHTALAASSKVLVSTIIPSNVNIDETVLRLVGGLHIISDQLSANEGQYGALGVIKITDVAFAVGISAIPDPISDVEDDGWMLYVPFVNDFAFNSGVGFDGNAGNWFPFDSKSKRTIEDGNRLAVVIANASSTLGLSFALYMRTLVMVRGT